MRPSIRRIALVLVVASACLGVGSHIGTAETPPNRLSSPIAARTAGRLMLDDLAALTNQNWARVAGQDTELPPQVNGHDEFVAEWTKRALSALHGLHAGVVQQPFRTEDFPGLPAKKLGANVIVVVPGSRHPNEAIVVGAHPDGEPWSKGSAFDDASGCVLMLGLARSLGAYWRTHHPPAYTVEFVLFDGEEQGLTGSTAFIYNQLHGAVMPRPVFMIDEEQSGIGYPVRPFGLLGMDPLPSFAIVTPKVPADHLSANGILRFGHQIGPFTLPKATHLRRAEERIAAARTAAFATLRSAYSPMQYRSGELSAFAPADERYFVTADHSLGLSDNLPFQLIGLPTVTFSGDSNFYPRDAPSWSFPFDQPEDTLEAIACDTGGSPQPGPALGAALELPVIMSSILVRQYAPAAAGSGIAVFSMPAGAGKTLRLDGIGGGALRWTFGDGGSAWGVSVTHTYARPGTYRLTVRNSSGVSTWPVKVGKREARFAPYATGSVPPRKEWQPPELRNIPGCH